MANTIVVALVGGLLAFTQTITLFVLKDLRERIMRLEKLAMKAS